jgi:hypothetical protein
VQDSDNGSGSRCSEHVWTIQAVWPATRNLKYSEDRENDKKKKAYNLGGMSGARGIDEGW